MEKKIKDFSLYIIGTTATGKTKLSLSMGKNFNGQIVSADSMQMYRNADILTAKATIEEQSIAKHHMIDIFDLRVTNFNRNDYYHLAKAAFDKIHGENSFPIVIGGTNYYIETLLFKQKISENRINLDDPNAFILQMQNNNNTANNSSNQDPQLQKHNKNDQNDEDEYDEDNQLPPLLNIDENEGESDKSNIEKEVEVRALLQQMSNADKYSKLKEIDPLLSNKLHPNDDRRILSYLTQALVTGIAPSKVMDDHEDVPLRDKNCLIFWPRCKSKEKLDSQIRKRIYEMISEDGIYEAFYIFDEIVPSNVTSEEDPVFLKGVLQSIGYKEFFSFYKLFQSKNYPQNISREEKVGLIKALMNDEGEGKKNITQCIEKLITHTIQYTKRQLKWIRHRIMINSDSEEIKNRLFVFEFDEFTSENFKEKAIDPANSIMKRYFELAEKYNEKSSEELHPIQQLANDEIYNKYLINIDELMEVRKGHYKKGLNDWKNYHCDTCKKEIYGELNWSIHNNSKRHKRVLKSKEKSELRAKYLTETNKLNEEVEKGNLSEEENKIHLIQEELKENNGANIEDNLLDNEKQIKNE